jgi:hypothetical protein
MIDADQLPAASTTASVTCQFSATAYRFPIGSVIVVTPFCRWLTTQELDMANPEELLEAAEAIRDVRRLPAVQRHEQLEDCCRKLKNGLVGNIARSLKG